MPIVKPEIVVGFVTGDENVIPSDGSEVTIYSEIELPPVTVGSVQEIMAVPELTPLTTEIFVGAAGRPTGVDVTVDGVEEPDTLFAVTENVYDVPFVKPVIAYVFVPGGAVIAGVTGTDVIVNPVIGRPPPVAACVHDNVIKPEPATAESDEGGGGGDVYIYAWEVPCIELPEELTITTPK